MSGVLEGEVAIVTGAGRGFGRAIAERLAKEGAKICATARNKAQLDEVVFVGSLIGEHQLAASVLLPSVQAFHDFVAGRLATVPGLRGLRSSLIANVYKLPLRLPIPTPPGGS